MKQSTPFVSFAILNWNGLENTKLCLASLKKLDYPNYEVIVVDNGSEDGSKPYFEKQKDIVYVDLPKNLGFTGGHLKAAEAAKGEYLAILNNDLVVDPEWLNRCLETFQRHPKAGVVGGKSFKWNDQNKAFDSDNEYYAFQEVDPKTGYTRTLLVGEEERPVDSISGAALLIKKEALNKVGYFDDRFFAYYEETDLIARMLRGGYKAYYNPEAYTWHKVAGSSKGGEASYFYLFQMHRNRFLFGYKNLDEPYLRVFMNNYRREYQNALYRLIRSRGKDIEAKARVDAYRWNKKHQSEANEARQSVLKLGKSYVKHLKEYEPKDVTVVIPCYNYGAYVSEAVDSVLKQTLLPKHIIILNDGSTDDSRKVLSKYAKNPLITVINKPNSGVIDTKNQGLKLSDTYWTIFFDADDVLKKQYIEKTVETARDYNYDIVYTDMQLFGAVNDTFVSRHYSLFDILQRNYIHNSALIKTTFLKQVGGYKQEMKDGLEDWELYLSLIEAGAKPGYLPLALFKYRQHSGSMSRNQHVENNKERQLYETLIALHPNLFKHMSPLRRSLLRAIKYPFWFVRYPGLALVVIKSLPGALVAFLRHILHNMRTYLHQKRTPPLQ